jgi:hypothetical protein
MKIAFHSPVLDVRGTCVSLYDYAHYNETLLNNKSIILTPISGVVNSDTIAIEKFHSRFQVYYYKNMNEFEDVLSDCDILYTIKYGKNNGIIAKNIKTIVHCVFDMTEPHGDVYAGVSKALATKYKSTLFVPHMIGLEPSKTKDNLRDQLNIPKDAIVFGRYGGQDTFNLQFARDVISQVVNRVDNIYFLLCNTPAFYNHPQIIYLDKIVNADDKNKFICTCDAHLECGTLGHSFGLSIGEFSINNKPIITYKSPSLWNTSHLEILKDVGVYYTTREEFYNILIKFDPENYKNKDNNCYKEYSPENVMKIFKQVFITGDE